MDQSRTLACEVVDCGMVVKECDTWRPRVCWTLGRYSAAGRAEEKVVVGVELVGLVPWEGGDRRQSNPGMGSGDQTNVRHDS